MFDFRRIDCPICKVDDTTVRGVRGGATHRHQQGIECTVVECNRCKLLYANPFPFPKPDAVLYGDPGEYFAGTDEDAKVQHYRGVARQMQALCGDPQPRIVDVGCGRGEFLAACKLEGLHAAEGIDISAEFVSHACRRHGVNATVSTVEQFAAPERQGQYDIVMLNAVLEHVHDPSSVLASVASLLRRGGVCYIDIPNERHLTAELMNSFNRLTGKPAVYYLAPTWTPYHVFGFGKHTVRHALRQHGFQLVSMVAEAYPVVPRAGNLLRQAAAVAATTLNRIGNLTDTAGNFTIIARRG